MCYYILLVKRTSYKRIVIANIMLQYSCVDRDKKAFFGQPENFNNGRCTKKAVIFYENLIIS